MHTTNGGSMNDEVRERKQYEWDEWCDIFKMRDQAHKDN